MIAHSAIHSSDLVGSVFISNTRKRMFAWPRRLPVIAAMLWAVLAVLTSSASALALDASDLPSIRLGKKCVTTSMQLKRVVTMLDDDPRWEFRWDEKMVTRTGLVAAIVDHKGPESYLLQFSFIRTKTIGEAKLVRIATASKHDTAGLAGRVGCR